MELQQNACVIVDEAQFLTKEEVMYLVGLVDDLGIPVICYGLRADFKGDLFPGSEALLVMADKIEEVKTICWCGKKATFNARFDRTPEAGETGKLVFQITDGAKLRRIVDLLGFSRSRTWPCTSTSDCWRRSAAGRPSCGGCSSPGAASRTGQAVPPGAGDLPPAGEPGAGGAAAGVRLSPRAWPATAASSPTSSRATRSRTFSPSWRAGGGHERQ